jgi:hypothetical protein
MATYISVLISDLHKPYWKAVQWDDDLGRLRANRFYTAGVNKNFSKSEKDFELEEKELIETTTHSKGTAKIIERDS